MRGWQYECFLSGERGGRVALVEGGNVLVGLVKKIAPAVKTATCGTAAEVHQLRELVAA